MNADDTEIQGLERILARLMLRGVQSSAAALGVGLALWAAGIAPAQGEWLLNAGLLALMATPILRVAVSVVDAIRLRDWFFVVTTAIVAVLLSLSVGYALLVRR